MREVYLGKSEKGVCIASCDHHGLLQVWMLDESCGRMEWFMKHNCNLMYVLRKNYYLQASGPWVLQDVNYNLYRDHLFPNSIKEALVEEKYDWDSDNDNVLLGNEDRAERHHCGHHWNSCKVQDSGNMYPTEYEYFADMWPDINVSFPYTPSWTSGLTEAAKLIRRAQVNRVLRHGAPRARRTGNKQQGIKFHMPSGKSAASQRLRKNQIKSDNL
ncbi:hypothetical protein C2845_PM02G03470 [Panicum miliaceum]|uniref:F-box associated domain-containing protein n=1 Tax=Panicum miliaceum TaxID=4540 RepID=A0A3L6S6J9_PANMI|nr:hypothetical protein C2845_PM02G03470 [Panicum miliaceum]